MLLRCTPQSQQLRRVDQQLPSWLQSGPAAFGPGYESRDHPKDCSSSNCTWPNPWASRCKVFGSAASRRVSAFYVFSCLALSLPSLSLCCSCVYKVITQPEIKFIRRRRRLKNVFSCAFFCCAVCTNSFWGRLKGFFLPLPLPLQQLATLSAGLVQCQVWAVRSGRESYAD